MEISTAEAAERLGVSQARVSQMLRSGELHGRKLSSRGWLVDLMSVQQRDRLGGPDGRPWSTRTLMVVLAALSDGVSTDSKISALIRNTEPELLWRRIAQGVKVTLYTVRELEIVRSSLIPTGESALEAINSDVLGSSRVLHGYLRPGLSLEDLADEAGMVADAEGNVAIHEFIDESGVVTLKAIPRALVAADSARSTTTRVHSAGVRALEQMRDAWLKSDM